MAMYSAALKQQMIGKMMPPHSQSVPRISKESGIPIATLYNWRSQSLQQGLVVPATHKHADQWNAKARFAVLVQTATLNDAELAEYCRQQGLYPEQVQSWKADFEAALEPVRHPANKQLAIEQRKVKQLEKELKRKEKALAETATLLVISKKMQAIWGNSKEED